MPKYLSKEEMYSQCNAKGNFIPKKELDINKIKSMVKIAQEDLETARELKPKLRWNTIYKLSYDALHQLTEAFILFEKIKSLNHQCLFSYL